MMSFPLALVSPISNPPLVAINAFHNAMLNGHNKYTTTAGLPALRKRIAEKTWTSRCPGLDESNVCMTMSGTNALLNIFATLVNPGQNVLLPEPYFPLYGPDVELWGGETRFYECSFENEFVPTIEHLETLVDENTSAILYNFPSNPTGATITAEQRDELLAFAQRHDLWLITDEVYDRIVFNGEHVSFVGCDDERVILINSFSKTYAMTGWRIGYILSANREAIGQMIKIQYYITACSNDAMQYAVLAAIDQADDYPDEMCAEFQARQGSDLLSVECHARCSMPCSRRCILRFPQGRCSGDE